MLTHLANALAGSSGAVLSSALGQLGPALCASPAVKNLLQAAGRSAFSTSSPASSSSPCPHDCTPSQRQFNRMFHASKADNQLVSPAPAAQDDDDEPIPEISGNVHSLDSFTSVDGPGLRYMIFLQGCVFRCKFCSNPDTWSLKGGRLMTSKEIAKKLARVTPYLKANHGGITVSGGEPLLQPYFLAAMYQEAHKLGLSTCLDTTGQGSHSHWDIVLPHTDHILLCPKAPDSKVYEELTGQKQGGMLKFADEAASRGIPTWLRYVMIPDMTDRDSDVQWLADFTKAHPNIEMIDLLPLHRLGVNKWREMGLKYPLEKQRLPSREEVEAFAGKLREKGVKVIC